MCTIQYKLLSQLTTKNEACNPKAEKEGRKEGKKRENERDHKCMRRYLV